MKTKTIFGIFFVLILLTGATIGGQYLGAYVFTKLQKLPQSIIGITTLYDYWHAFGHIKKVQQAIVVSGLASIAPPVFLIILLIVALSPKKRSLHGDAKFATEPEIRMANLFETEQKNKSQPAIILGKYKDKFVSFYGQQFVAVAAPTRSGKGVALIIPNLLSYPHSVVVNDNKLENYRITAGFRKAHGQEVYCFCPDHPDIRSHRWNPLSYIRPDRARRIDDILGIANLLYPLPMDADGATRFFNDNAQTLFLGLNLYCLDTPGEPCNLPHILNLTTPSTGEALHVWLKKTIKERDDNNNSLSPECVNALNAFLSNEEETLSNIQSTMCAPLNIFRSPAVAAAMTENDFDFRDVRKKKMSIYIGIKPNNLTTFSRLINLFFSQLINENTNELPEDNPDLKYQCLMIMDEFTAMGRVGIIQSAVSYIAGYNMRLFLIFQNMSQLDTFYKKEGRKTLMTNVAAQVMYAPLDNDDAKEYSEMLGYLTEKATSKGRSSGVHTTNSQNISDHKRALLMPQEVKQIGQQKEIISLENLNSFLADKIVWYKDPAFKDRGNNLFTGDIKYQPPTIPELKIIYAQRAGYTPIIREVELSEIQNMSAIDFTNKDEILASVFEIMGSDFLELIDANLETV